MSSDAEQIRVAARAVSGLAGRTRAAGAAVTGAGRTRWESQAARTFRERLDDRRLAFSSRADDLDELSRSLMSHAHHVEVHEAAVIKAIFALEKAGNAVINDATDLAGELPKTSHDAGNFALDAAKNTLVTMNPLTSMRRVR